METTLPERLLIIAKDNYLSTRQFEIRIGKTSGYINMMKKNKSSPSVSVILKIKKEFAKYNLLWIITGEGSKYDTLDNPEESSTIDIDKLDTIINQNTLIIKAFNDLDRRIVENNEQNAIVVKTQDEKIDTLAEVIIGLKLGDSKSIENQENGN